MKTTDRTIVQLCDSQFDNERTLCYNEWSCLNFGFELQGGIMIWFKCSVSVSDEKRHEVHGYKYIDIMVNGTPVVSATCKPLVPWGGMAWIITECHDNRFEELCDFKRQAFYKEPLIRHAFRWIRDRAPEATFIGELDGGL